MADDDDWVSDTDTVEGDRFNKADFNKVSVKAPNERPELVKGDKPSHQTFGISSAPPATDYNNYKPVEAPPIPSNKPVANQNFNSGDPPVPAPKPVLKGADENLALQIEREAMNEQKELAQARSFSSNNINKQNSFNQPKPNPGGNDRFQGNFSQDIIDFFTEMNKKTFSEQAVEFLNAYWDEVGDQAEFIFAVAYKIFTEADMHRQGITLFFQYEEGSNVDYPTYLYFYEKLVKFVGQNPEWRSGQYEKSAVYEVKTAIKHKKDLQEKVDVNFDGQISFLEFLLYQYNTFSNPAQFMERARMAGDEHPAIVAARLALDEVMERIKAYERERARLEEGAKLPGVQGLTFKHQLAQLDASPLAEELNKALITAEAAVRIAVKKFQGMTGAFSGAGQEGFNPRGALWWMQRDLQEKKKYKRG